MVNCLCPPLEGVGGGGSRPNTCHWSQNEESLFVMDLDNLTILHYLELVPFPLPIFPDFPLLWFPLSSRLYYSAKELQ
jgi:hypothetical protein